MNSIFCLRSILLISEIFMYNRLLECNITGFLRALWRRDGIATNLSQCSCRLRISRFTSIRYSDLFPF
jgi:hypothetical protein